MNPNITKIIDQYIAGELSEEDKIIFENRLKETPELLEELELQKLVIEGAKRAGQRINIKKAKKLYHLNKLLKWGTISMSAFAIAFFASISFFSNGNDISIDEANRIIIAQNDAINSSESAKAIIESANGEREMKGFPVSFDSETIIESSIPSGFLVSTSYFVVNPKRDTTLHIGAEGTQLFIPKYAFVDQNGKTIKALVTIEYQEYKNSADIAFSGIPMIYSKGSTDYMFNSSGMFSIFGSSNGKPVEVSRNKTMKIDYKLVRKNPDTKFYVLKEDSSNWQFVSDLQKENNSNNSINCPPREEISEDDVVANHKQLIADTIEGEPVWNENDLEQIENEKREKGRHRRNVFGLFHKNNNRDLAWEVAEGEGPKEGNKGGTLLAPGMDAGHTYPDIIRGLNVGRFGVYNCDQMYRLKNRINVTATYKDENGSIIRDGKVLSMIDLDYTGAFSFDPKSFTCNSKANNVLLLFTRSGKLYLLDKDEFQKLDIRNGAHTFKVRNVTESIKSTKDLEAHLDL